MGRRLLTMKDRAQIGSGIKAGPTDEEIGELIDRDRTVIWREPRRNSTTTRSYRPVHADSQAQKRRSRPQTRTIDADPVLPERVRAGLPAWDPRQIAGRLHLEATDPTVETTTTSPDAQGRTVSHEALYRWIYAPTGELAKSGILVLSKHTQRTRRRRLGERTGGRIVGMVSIDDCPEAAADRRVPGSREGI